MEMSLAAEPLARGFTQRETRGQEERELEALLPAPSLPGLPASSFKATTPTGEPPPRVAAP